MTETKKETEVVVIGAGPGGYVAAIRAATLGKKVTLIEKEGVLGGVCLNHGCIPTKAIIHASNFYNILSHLNDMGITIHKYTVDIKKMVGWKDSIVKKLEQGIQDLCKKHNIQTIQGTATFQTPTQLTIQTSQDPITLTFQHAIIATGSSTIQIPAFPFSDPAVLNPRQALALKEIPSKLVIIGGGYIGTEMGTVYGKLGSEVHIIELQNRLLSSLEEDLVEIVADRLKSFNVTTHLNSKAISMEKKDKKLYINIEEAGQPKKIEADKILVVVGSRPNSKNIGLENINIKTDKKGFIIVDKQMRTSQNNIFAIGDVVGQPMLAHKASREAKVAAEAIAGLPSYFDNRVIPFVVFNDPEIISVGLTEDQAKEKGYEIKVGRFPFTALGKAHTINDPEGFLKLISEKETGILLGMHAVGPSVSNIIGEAALAIEMNATIEDISLTIHPHPTLPESLVEAAELILRQSIHIFQDDEENSH